MCKIYNRSYCNTPSSCCPAYHQTELNGSGTQFTRLNAQATHVCRYYYAATMTSENWKAFSALEWGPDALIRATFPLTQRAKPATQSRFASALSCHISILVKLCLRSSFGGSEISISLRDVLWKLKAPFSLCGLGEKKVFSHPASESFSEVDVLLER
ncbi:hypothetical protein Plhal304r1_c050g0133531 [Plasmopara halstedii]